MVFLYVRITALKVFSYAQIRRLCHPVAEVVEAGAALLVARDGATDLAGRRRAAALRLPAAGPPASCSGGGGE